MMFPTGGLREGRTSCEFPTASYISFYTNIADPCIYISSLPVRPIPSFSLDLFLDNGPLQVIQLSQGKLHLLCILRHLARPSSCHLTQRLAGRFAVLHELRADLNRPLLCQMSAPPSSLFVLFIAYRAQPQTGGEELASSSQLLKELTMYL